MEVSEKQPNGVPAAVPSHQFGQMKIIKNVIVVSFAFLCLFTAFQSTALLQSSLNIEKAIGSGSLSIIYGALVASCLFIPTFMIAHLGCKWTIPISMIGYILYMCANFYPIWGLMAPTAVILGLGGAALWSAKCSYLTQVGVWYAKMTNRSEDAVINTFFGIFFMIFQTSSVWGNIISSQILAPNKDNSSVDTRPEVLELCGANFCLENDNVTSQKNLQPPEQYKVYIVCGIYLAFAVAGALIVIFGLDPIRLDKEINREERRVSPKLLIATFKHLFTSRYQYLLIPLTIYSGVEQAFIGGDFTRSYITCTLGVWNIGYVMICYGVVDAICSFAFGRLVQYVGHIPFFILAFLVHGGCQIALLLWSPDPAQVVIYYVIAGFWGMGDAVIQTQINALYGFLFKDNTEPAFSNYRLWESVGFIVTYAYNDYLCTNVKLYVCIGVLCVGMVGYGIVEIIHRNTKSENSYALDRRD